MAAPLIGRGEELHRLRRVLDVSGPAAAVVVGPAGVGKSRLLAELGATAAEQGWMVKRLYGAPALRSVPMGALAHLFAEHPSEDPTLLLRTAMAQLRQRSPEAPHLVLVDDAHALDTRSAALVHQLITHAEASVVLAVRSEAATAQEITSLWAEGTADRIDVAPLTRDSSDQLVQWLLGGPVHPSLLDEAWALALGHPLYLTVALQGALEADGVVIVDGRWERAGSLMSQRLRDLVRSAMNDLPPDERQSMTVVALAEPVALPLLEQLVGGEPVERLRLRGLLTLDDAAGDVDVRTPHPLYAEVISATLAADQQRTISSQLAHAVLASPSVNPSDMLRAVVWLLEAGEQPGAHIALTAADEAARRLDHALAQRLAQAALAQEPGSTLARVALGRALSFQGEGEKAEEVLAAAAPATDAETSVVAVARGHNLAFTLARPAEAARLLSDAAAAVGIGLRWPLDMERALYGAMSGDFRDVVDATQAALDNPDTPPPAQVQGWVNLLLAQAITGDLGEFEAGYSHALDLAAQHSDHVPMARVQLDMAGSWGWALSGRLADGLDVLRGGCRASTLAGAPDPMYFSWLGALECLHGGFDDAITTQRRALELFETADPFRMTPQCVGLLAMQLGQAGSPDPALLATLDAAERDAAGEARLMVWLTRGRAWHAAAHGEITAAAQLAADAGRHAIDHGHVTWGALALHDAVRLGVPEMVHEPLLEAVNVTNGARLLEIMVAQSTCLLAGDDAGLEAASHGFRDCGSPLLAAEAASQLARLHAARGDDVMSRRAAILARRCWAECPSAQTPALLALPEALTQRETHIAELVAGGRSSRDVAEALVLSVRTVDNHLHAVYRKLGMAGRDELSDLFGGASLR